MPRWKKCVDMSGVDPIGKRAIENSSSNRATLGSHASVGGKGGGGFGHTGKASRTRADRKGINGDNILEPVPEFIEAPSEHVIANKNNSWIVLGRDRPAGLDTGYGGMGHTQAASIDIVVGRMGFMASSVSILGEKAWVDPDFINDAARIYISQKTDLEKNFGLCPAFGKPGDPGRSALRSGIGLKADVIEIVSREFVEIRAYSAGTNHGHDGPSSQSNPEPPLNSQGGTVLARQGVRLISGNGEIDLRDSAMDLRGLHPMVRGHCLKMAFEDLLMLMKDLAGIMSSFAVVQQGWNKAMKEHWHYSPFFAHPTMPASGVVSTAALGMQETKNMFTKVHSAIAAYHSSLGSFNMNFLTPSGPKYINSRFHQLN